MQGLKYKLVVVTDYSLFNYEAPLVAVATLQYMDYREGNICCVPVEQPFHWIRGRESQLTLILE